MPRTLFSLLLLSLFSTLLSAKSKIDRRMVKALQADVSYLASDALEGRRTGTEGERKAGDYLIARYQKLGIPAYGPAYRHSYSFTRGKELGNTSIAVGGQSMQMGAEVFPFAFSANGNVSGQVLVDVQEQDAIWTLPLYSNAEEADNPHFDAEKAAFEKARDAARDGATGVLFFDSYNSRYVPAFNSHSDFETLTIPVAFASYRQWQHLTANGANTVSVSMDIALVKPEHQSDNIIAFINNGAPYTVVIGAHYDHLGHGEDGGSLYAGKDRQIHNGADDNASGTAALLQLAEWIKRQKVRKMGFNYNYVFAHFSGEELGLLGSKAFVKEAGIDSSRIAYMINMDMLGRLADSSSALTVGGIGTSPAWSVIPDAIRKQGFRLSSDSSGVGPSDHTSFYNKGIPVLFFFTGVHSDYHKPSDDADKVNYAGEARVIGAIIEVIKTMDRTPKPQFTPTKQSSMGKVRFKVTLGIMPDYSYQGEGVRVDGVTDGKPAAKAGIMAGDVIIRLGQDDIRGMQSYMEALSHQKAGNVTEVTIRRAGKELKLPIAL